MRSMRVPIVKILQNSGSKTIRSQYIIEKKNLKEVNSSKDKSPNNTIGLIDLSFLKLECSIKLNMCGSF